MTNHARWHRIGAVEELKDREVQEVVVEGVRIALTYLDGRFGAISGECLHAKGPLGHGHIADGYVVCPWHGWMFDRLNGKARPGIPAAVPCFELKEQDGGLWINLEALSQGQHADHPPHPLARPVERAPGPLRVAGISTTSMSAGLPRFSTSDHLLERALREAERRGAETRLHQLRRIKFKPCEGYYSEAAEACTWPCTLTLFDPEDGLEPVYEAFVHWADVILVATPIRWGNASSLYYQMAERMNCIQNQLTLGHEGLIRNKVAGFLITGGQDNIQAVAGQMLCFFAELGFRFPPFPFVAHSRGWTAEDMEANIETVRTDPALAEHVDDLVSRCLDEARRLIPA